MSKRQPMQQHISERITANRQRIDRQREREEREAAIIREMAKTNPDT